VIISPSFPPDFLVSCFLFFEPSLDLIFRSAEQRKKTCELKKQIIKLEQEELEVATELSNLKSKQEEISSKNSTLEKQYMFLFGQRKKEAFCNLTMM